MYDRFNRKINYLRISVTDRCNLRCIYCMPEEGIRLLPHDEILSFEEIFRVAETAVAMGVDKIRITGGEPLVRKNITDLVSMLAGLPGVNDLSMTTNGIYLEQYAEALAAAGLYRVNISLDSMDPERYRLITRTGDIHDVLKGIDAALHAGLTPVKINCVIKKSPLEKDARDVAAFCLEKGLEIRYIMEMNLKTGSFSKVIGGEGGDCAFCNRLRLTANGKVKPCLFSDLEYDVRTMGIREALTAALENKPKHGSANKTNAFCNIGG
ncbi:MAG: GTP 3',8-cyclase MoaA [Bacteroidales bacterium]|nr:GTP 3',8-cyclase MoaA [Bacteroidales bacterium]